MVARKAPKVVLQEIEGARMKWRQSYSGFGHSTMIRTIAEGSCTKSRIEQCQFVSRRFHSSYGHEKYFLSLYM